jgi:hypothetical protein
VVHSTSAIWRPSRFELRRDGRWHPCPSVRRPRDGAAHRNRQRASEYGEPVDLFEHVAQRWWLTLGTKVSPAHVVLCMIDLKLARLVRDPKHLDSQVDVAGYAAVLREVGR